MKLCCLNRTLLLSMNSVKWHTQYFCDALLMIFFYIFKNDDFCWGGGVKTIIAKLFIYFTIRHTLFTPSLVYFQRSTTSSFRGHLKLQTHLLKEYKGNCNFRTLKQIKQNYYYSFFSSNCNMWLVVIFSTLYVKNVKFYRPLVGTI